MCLLCWIWRSGPGNKDSMLLWDLNCTNNEGLQHQNCCFSAADCIMTGSFWGNRSSIDGLIPSLWRPLWLPMAWLEPWPARVTLAVGGWRLYHTKNPPEPRVLPCVSKCTTDLHWCYGLVLKVCAAAPCDGGAGEGERCLGLCGGRHGPGVGGHRQLCSIPRCRHFHREGISALTLPCFCRFYVEVWSAFAPDDRMWTRSWSAQTVQRREWCWKMGQRSAAKWCYQTPLQMLPSGNLLRRYSRDHGTHTMTTGTGLLFHCLFFSSRRRVSFLQSSSVPWSRSTTPRLLPKSMVNTFCLAKPDAVKNDIVTINLENQPWLHLYWPPTVAVDSLPNFLAAPTANGEPGPHHQCSIHINCESVDVLETAYKEALNGRPSSRFAVVPLIASARSLLQIPPFTFRFYSSALSWKGTVLHVEMTSRHFG